MLFKFDLSGYTLRVDQSKKVIIIGAGPAGLFCAHQLLAKNYQVKLYDHSSGAGKKFLVAGNGGLNLTHSENLELFSLKYGVESKRFFKLLSLFGPNELRDWFKEIGIETFIGSSGRVFPRQLKSAHVLKSLLQALKKNKNFSLHLDHKLINICKERNIIFSSKKIEAAAPHLILALGGSSWKKTGSDGQWPHLFSHYNIKINPFLPSNCGFEYPWSDYFKDAFKRTPIKNVTLSIDEHSKRGEIMITSYGIEGGAVYALSSFLRGKLLKHQPAVIKIDFKPDLNLGDIISKLQTRNKKKSLASFLKKSLGFNFLILLKELYPDDDFNEARTLAHKIKEAKIELRAMHPIDEAISTAGGVCFTEVSQFMQLKKLPGVYVAGEMLDFDAPTGGYLLQGAFSTAYACIQGITSHSIS